jgi:hypothetical protein
VGVLNRRSTHRPCHLRLARRPPGSLRGGVPGPPKGRLPTPTDGHVLHITRRLPELAASALAVAPIHRLPGSCIPEARALVTGASLLAASARGSGGYGGFRKRRAPTRHPCHSRLALRWANAAPAWYRGTSRPRVAGRQDGHVLAITWRLPRRHSRQPRRPWHMRTHSQCRGRRVDAVDGWAPKACC